MKVFLIILAILVVLALASWLGYYLYKNSLVDKLMYNCTADCAMRRKTLMGKSIPELKQLIANVIALGAGLGNITPPF